MVVLLLVLVDAELNARLDEISQYYRDEGVCSGEDCHRLMIQVSELCDHGHGPMTWVGHLCPTWDRPVTSKCLHTEQL